MSEVQSRWCGDAEMGRGGRPVLYGLCPKDPRQKRPIKVSKDCDTWVLIIQLSRPIHVETVLNDRDTYPDTQQAPPLFVFLNDTILSTRCLDAWMQETRIVKPLQRFHSRI